MMHSRSLQIKKWFTQLFQISRYVRFELKLSGGNIAKKKPQCTVSFFYFNTSKQKLVSISLSSPYPISEMLGRIYLGPTLSRYPNFVVTVCVKTHAEFHQSTHEKGPSTKIMIHVKRDYCT